MTTTTAKAPAREEDSSPVALTNPGASEVLAADVTAGRAADFLASEGLAASEDTGAREVAGLALPYGEDLERLDFLTGATHQRFNPGSAVWRDNATLFYGHDHLTNGLPIGKAIGEDDGEAGSRARGIFSKTPKADEVHTLVKDGVLNRYSVGFYRKTNHLEEEDGRLVLVHDEIDVFEVSIVPDPAFQSAQIDTVLSARTLPASPPSPAKETRMTTDTLATAEDVTALAASVDNLERRIATLAAPAGPEGLEAAPAVPGESYGHFLKMVAAGDKEAVDFLAYVGGTTADLGTVLKDSWVGDRFRQIEAQRTVLNFFSRSPLPADGMGVEFGVVGTDTTKVERQENEGDTLAYGKITFDTDRAPLETYGGWGEMTFQQIQRSPFNVVETFFDALLRRYAQTTEAAVNARAMAAGIALPGGVLDMATTDGWTRFTIRAARYLKDQGYPLEGLLVGFDVFEDLALMRDPNAVDGDRFLNRDTGKINVVGLGGEVFNIPVVPVETGAVTDVIRAANSAAIRTYEDGRAPFRLQDEDITNLTKAASVYGYMVDATEVPNAIVKPATV